MQISFEKIVWLPIVAFGNDGDKGGGVNDPVSYKVGCKHVADASIWPIFTDYYHVHRE